MGLIPPFPPSFLLHIHRLSNGAQPVSWLTLHADPWRSVPACLCRAPSVVAGPMAVSHLWEWVDIRSLQASSPSAWGGLPAPNMSSTDASVSQYLRTPDGPQMDTGASLPTLKAFQVHGRSCVALDLTFYSPWLSWWVEMIRDFPCSKHEFTKQNSQVE